MFFSKTVQFMYNQCSLSQAIDSLTYFTELFVSTFDIIFLMVLYVQGSSTSHILRVTHGISGT